MFSNCHSLLQSRVERIIEENLVTDIVDRVKESNSKSDPCALVYMRNVKPVAQNGPQCGLVALKMALDPLSTNETTLSMDEIFEEAKRIGITNNGEIFSVPWLAKLASVLRPSCQAMITEMDQYQGEAASFVLGTLSSRKFLLVPYDAGKNGEPCLNNGHAAHWALLMGFLIIDSTTDPVVYEQIASTKAACQCLQPDSNIRKLYAFNSASSDDLCSAHRHGFQTLLSRIDAWTNPVYVLALHGRSKHVAVWQLDKLIESNENLREMAPKRLSDGLVYKLPPEGVEGGLAGKMLLLG